MNEKTLTTLAEVNGDEAFVNQKKAGTDWLSLPSVLTDGLISDYRSFG